MVYKDNQRNACFYRLSFDLGICAQTWWRCCCLCCEKLCGLRQRPKLAVVASRITTAKGHFAVEIRGKTTTKFGSKIRSLFLGLFLTSLSQRAKSYYTCWPACALQAVQTSACACNDSNRIYTPSDSKYPSRLGPKKKKWALRKTNILLKFRIFFLKNWYIICQGWNVFFLNENTS